MVIERREWRGSGERERKILLLLAGPALKLSFVVEIASTGQSVDEN